VTEIEKSLYLAQVKRTSCWTCKSRGPESPGPQPDVAVDPAAHGEPAASDKALADLDAKILDALAGKNPPAALADNLPLKLKSSSGKEACLRRSDS